MLRKSTIKNLKTLYLGKSKRLMPLKNLLCIKVVSYFKVIVFRYFLYKCINPILEKLKKSYICATF